MRLIFNRRNIIPIIKDVVKNMVLHDAGFLAAGISFFAFLSLLPLCLVGINVIGWILSFSFIQNQVSAGLNFLSGATAQGDTSFEYVVTLLKSFLPTNSTWVEQELKGLSEHVGRNVLINLCIGMWSGRLMFMGLESSLYRVWGVPIQRSWIKRSILGLELVAVTWILGIIMLGGAGFLNIVKKLLMHLSLPELWGFSVDQALIWSWTTSWIVTPLGASIIFMMVYRLLPHKPIAWSYIVPGALFSGFAYKITSYFYLIYAVYYAEISVIYGSIWYIIGLVFWMYVVAYIFLIGAELIHACETYEACEWEQVRKAKQNAAKKYAKRHKKTLTDMEPNDKKSAE